MERRSPTVQPYMPRRLCMLVCMKRLNLSMTPEFERGLRQYMERRKIARKSDAIRAALREAVTKSSDAQECTTELGSEWD